MTENGWEIGLKKAWDWAADWNNYWNLFLLHKKTQGHVTPASDETTGQSKTLT